MFKSSSPPPTGHPGRAINCRCWAEEVVATFPVEFEYFVNKYDVKTWPKPPINGILTEGLATKAKYRKRGEKSLFDKYGGEWRPDIINQYHNLH